MSPLFYILHCRDLIPADFEGNLQQALGARDTALTAGKIASDLAALGKAGVIRLTTPSADLPLSPAQPETRGLSQARRSKRGVWDTWSVASYTGLTRGRHQEAPARDVDALEDGATGTVDASGEAGEWGAGLLGFPRGAGAGSFIHALMEEADFTATRDNEPWIATRCAEYGYEGRWAPALAQMISAVSRAPLADGERSFTLARVPRAPRLTELEFHLPVHRLDPEGLASRLAAAGGEWLDLAQTAAGLGFPVMHGFLQGFIDCVVRAEGRYYVLDWKSNHLGPRPASYGQDSLARSMRENLYTLQYLLYEVALHRYLGSRLAGYDIERDLGGAFYVFVRGVRDDWPGAGVFHGRAPAELIHGIDRLLGAGEAAL